MKTRTITSQPQLERREEQPTLGIRVQTPMRGMGKVVGLLMRELDAWMERSGITALGPPLLRYYVIDMAGEMDIEAAYPTAAGLPGDERVRPGILPAGTYAALVYQGSGLTGNRALIEWARDNAVAWDRWDDPNGDAFRCRYERYLTDPMVEPRKTRWQVEVAIKVKD